jgi:hypothetical protein
MTKAYSLQRQMANHLIGHMIGSAQKKPIGTDPCGCSKSQTFLTLKVRKKSGASGVAVRAAQIGIVDSPPLRTFLGFCDAADNGLWTIRKSARDGYSFHKTLQIA